MAGVSTKVDDHLRLQRNLRYDARGKPIRQTFASGVVSEREWDADIERLTRIYTYLPGGTPVEFQDLRYDYDPVGNPLQISDALTMSCLPSVRPINYCSTRSSGELARDAVPSADPDRCSMNCRPKVLVLAEDRPASLYDLPTA